MSEKRHVTSAAEWKELPQIVAPIISSPEKEGSSYLVHTVGFVMTDQRQCDRLGLRPKDQVAGKLALPTALVEFDGKKRLCRLPIEVTPWTIEVVALAQAGQLEFPMIIEFGKLDGHTYVEIK
jgi:hypothetical protein